MRHLAKPSRKPLCFLMALAVLLTAFSTFTFSARAAGTPTSLGLGEHGIKAYEDGWLYSYGGKGETNSDGVRVSDCAGLIYAYFKDLGAVGNCMGGVSSQVKYNCVFSGDVDELDGIPRIHGLIVTMPNYNEPEYPYSHVGIYIGNNMAVDNSDYGTNMRYEAVVGSGRDWTAWHVFDNGTMYPSNGWYEFNGNLYHYSNCQYDVDTTVDGFTIGSDGIALDSNGQPLTADSSEAPTLSTEYVTASAVAQQLASLGYSGKDSTEDLVIGGDDVPSDDQLNGRVVGNGVRLRKDASTQSAMVATLNKNDPVQILESVTGETVTAEGQTTDQWYSVVTALGQKGYVISLYVEQESSLSAPVFTVSDSGDLIISAGEGCDIRYTTDGTRPTGESTPYTGPISVSGTYRAVAVKDDWTSPMSVVTFAGGTLFTDFTDQDWYFEHIDQAVSLGLFSGQGSGTFAPTTTITRAEFATALANLAGVDLSDYQGTSSFSDVGNAWYNGAVNWASSQKIMSGMGDGTFRPQDPITREQICVAVANYAGLTYNGGSSAFADDSSIASWAKNAVYACRDLGIISGMGYNTFAPKDNAQRAQACVVILKSYQNGL